jgi:hypothetical protein
MGLLLGQKLRNSKNEETKSGPIESMYRLNFTDPKTKSISSEAVPLYVVDSRSGRRRCQKRKSCMDDNDILPSFHSYLIFFGQDTHQSTAYVQPAVIEVSLT